MVRGIGAVLSFEDVLAEDEVEPLGAGMLATDPGTQAWLAGLLSLVLPGAGQIYLGQWWRGASLFIAAVPVCFALGLCNVAFAYDAWSLARRLREEPIAVDQSSKTLRALDIVLWLIRKVLGVVGSLFEFIILKIPGLNVLYLLHKNGMPQ